MYVCIYVYGDMMLPSKAEAEMSSGMSHPECYKRYVWESYWVAQKRRSAPGDISCGPGKLKECCMPELTFSRGHYFTWNGLQEGR
jgi:hypothetical protein